MSTRLQIVPDALPNKPQTYAPVKEVLEGKKRQLKSAAKEGGLSAIDLKEFISLGLAGEILASVDSLHAGLGVYIFSSVKLKEGMDMISKKLEAYRQEEASMPIEDMIPLLTLQGKLAEALTENGNNILTARSMLRKSNLPVATGSNFTSEGGPIQLMMVPDATTQKKPKLDQAPESENQSVQ